MESDSERQTKQAGNIVLEFRKTMNAQKSVFYEEVKIHNALPAMIKQRDGIQPFKRMLKEFTLNTV